MKKVDRLVVLGAGSAGLVAALILKARLTHLHIDVIASKNIGIVGVGEGSTEHWKDFLHFLKFLNVDPYQFITECDATYKCGVMFEDWTDEPYMHSVQVPFSEKVGQYHHVYARQISYNKPSYWMSSPLFWQNKIDPWFIGKPDETPVNQFHFNTYKLNEFLLKIAKKSGITIIDDEILDAELNSAGEISKLKGEKQDYEYDFFIDCSGFRRLLISKLGGKWNSYSKWLRMNSAFAFPTGDTENYNAWTLARAMDCGWMFRIPTFGRWGNGYIYDNNYISKESAKLEVEKYLGHEIDIVKEFNFDPGAIDKTWIKNCVAIGLSGSFFEPMEASSIGTSIQQTFILMHKLIHYDDKIIEQYNKMCNDIYENIRDYIALHYITKKNSTPFWKDQQLVELPNTLKSKLELWKHKLPIEEDFNGETGYILFKDANFITVMHGLGLFNQESIAYEYSKVSDSVKTDAEIILIKHQNFLDQVRAMPHKMALSMIRHAYSSKIP